MTFDSSQLTPVDDALEYLLRQVSQTQKTEHVMLSNALGRVLAKPQTSQIDVPPWANSAMDGYAVRYSDLAAQTALPVSQRIPAGAVGSALTPNTAARIFTGAPMPTGADTVIMQEQCSVDGSHVQLSSSIDGVEKGQNVRAMGEDIRTGQQVLAKGQRLRAQELGLLASLGLDSVLVYRKLKIAVLSTGDELIEPGSAAGLGQIYNSNRYTLAGLIAGLEMDFVPLGIIADSRVETERALQKASQQADIIISSGGVSVGEEDHVKAVIEGQGFIHLWKLAIKPGKPFAYGEFDGTPVLALPGNPSAVLVTFLILARPYLLKMQGMNSIRNTPAVAIADFEMPKPSNRRRYLHARVQFPQSTDAPIGTTEGFSANQELPNISQVYGRSLSDHLPKIQLYPQQSSGMLSGASWAQGIAVVEVGQSVTKGQPVLFYSFADLLN
ncbi:MAG: molybdopterin molybdotransferase MoeA [Pseudomonadales bacterium]|nr:molybdopterin molybdotransferase MoeA [Pseudomonadales bacterium]